MFLKRVQDYFKSRQEKKRRQFISNAQMNVNTFKIPFFQNPVIAHKIWAEGGTSLRSDRNSHRSFLRFIII